MRATDFEFRYRFWFVSLTYFVGFGCYWFDHLNASVALARWMFSTSDPHLHSLAARHAIQGLFILSAGLVTAAAWMRTWGGAYLRTEVARDGAVRTEKLVADGPYRHLRNPLYLGNLLLTAGMAMMASRTGGVVLIIGNVLVVWRLIGREEAALEQSQGEAYRAFLGAVPRLWPSLRPRLPASGSQAKWPQAFMGEAWVWIFALNGFVFAWRLSLTLYYTLQCASAAAYFLVWVALGRLRRRNSTGASSHQ